jgi:transcriptional regulator with XRE-family HTH domain
VGYDTRNRIEEVPVTAAALLRAARQARGLSQRGLATRADVRQPRIAEIESGRHDTTFSRLEELLAPLEYRLGPVPTGTRGVWEAALAVQEALAERDETTAWRQVIQLADDLEREEPALRVALAVAPPAGTGSPRFDALIAGVTDYRLRGLPRPTWLDSTDFRLSDPWDVEPLHELREEARRSTPRELARHGVYLHARELESV